jgi:hypothetical protein
MRYALRVSFISVGEFPGHTALGKALALFLFSLNYSLLITHDD